MRLSDYCSPGEAGKASWRRQLLVWPVKEGQVRSVCTWEAPLQGSWKHGAESGGMVLVRAHLTCLAWTQLWEPLNVKLWISNVILSAAESLQMFASR